MPYAVKSGNEEVVAMLLQAGDDIVSDFVLLISLVYCYACTIIDHLYMSVLKAAKATVSSEIVRRVAPKQPMQETRKAVEVKEAVAASTIVAAGMDTVTDLESLLPKTIDLDRYKKVRGKMSLYLL
jgi:hypothetical protein